MMSTLCHALLTEDESVLLKALEPSSHDRILALFAYGNGDAAFSLLQSVPHKIAIHDVFDQPSLAAQVQMKQWLFQNLDCSSFRKFVGIEAGFDVAKRTKIIETIFHDLSSSGRTFWSQRYGCLKKGMANSDSTHKWTKRFRKFLALYERLPTRSQKMMLRLGMPLAPLFFPYEERIHSLGYQQMKQNPDQYLASLSTRSDRLFEDSAIIPYQDFKYLSHEGCATIRRELHRLHMVETLKPRVEYNKIYFSNLIDYLSPSEFYEILKIVLPARTQPWTMFLNSAYESHSGHPYLQSGLDDGLFTIDWPLTKAMRVSDRVGIYPGLTIVRGTLKPGNMMS